MTIPNNDMVQIAARQLISGPHPNEKSVQLWLAILLVSLLGPDEVKLEYAVPSGHMDIFLPRIRVVIETKPRDEVDPNGVRDADSDETQFQQCERYVRDEWERERGKFRTFRMGYGLPWKAILTDGRVWWMWVWKILQDGELSKQPEEVKREFSSAKELEAGLRYLTQATWQPRLQP